MKILTKVLYFSWKKMYLIWCALGSIKALFTPNEVFNGGGKNTMSMKKVFFVVNLRLL